MQDYSVFSGYIYKTPYIFNIFEFSIINEGQFINQIFVWSTERKCSNCCKKEKINQNYIYSTHTQYLYMLYPRTDTSCPQLPKSVNACPLVHIECHQMMIAVVYCVCVVSLLQITILFAGRLQCMRLMPVSVSLKCLASVNLCVQSINVSDRLIRIGVLLLKRKCIRNWECSYE